MGRERGDRKSSLTPLISCGGFICMDTDFVAVDINGAQHSLSYWGVYVTSRRETEAEGLWRISAGYDPDTAEAIKKDGDPAETTELKSPTPSTTGR